MPEAKIKDKNHWFVEIVEDQSIIDSQIRQEAEDGLIATIIQGDLNQTTQVSKGQSDTAYSHNNELDNEKDDEFIFDK